MPSDNGINRRRFLGASTGALGASLSGGVQGASKAASSRPNVIVFYTDQQRSDSVGVYGRSPMDLTPNLDQVARSAVRFENTFTTQPVCAPARSTIQTGKYPTTTGVFHNSLILKDDEQTLAHYFKRAHYQTGYIGKWHLGGTTKKPVPLERRGGYDEWWTASDVLEFTSGPFEGHMFDANNRQIDFKKYRVDFLTDLAVDFIRQKKDNPFFLFLSFLEPHHQNGRNNQDVVDSKLDRFVAPEGYAERYRNNFHIPPDLAPFPGDWKSSLPNYYGSIARIDECYGRMLKELADHNLLDNTIVVFTSDHGCHFRTRNSEYKRSCHDASIRIPLVIRGPGFDAPRVVPELTSIVDLPPTLLEAAGIAVPKAMQGQSLLALAQGRQKNWRNEIMVQMREEALQRAIRTERWKYCIYNPESKRTEPSSTEYVERYLYDLAADPHEHVNLIGRAAYREIADDLQQRLIERMTTAGEPRPKVTPAKYYA
jgi:arylsulfatase A-like enzyme